MPPNELFMDSHDGCLVGRSKNLSSYSYCNLVRIRNLIAIYLKGLHSKEGGIPQIKSLGQV
jgi:hypothetical protein